MHQALGIDEPQQYKIKKHKPTAELESLFQQDVSGMDCFYRYYAIPGCSSMAYKPLFLIPLNRLLSSGVPKLYLMNDVLSVPLCDGCMYLYLHLAFKTKCKNTWVTRTAAMEHKTMKDIRIWMILNGNMFLELMRNKRNSAEDYYNKLMANVVHEEISLGDIINNKRVEYISFEDFRNRGKVIIKSWPQSDDI
jgi:hypothetical protein